MHSKFRDVSVENKITLKKKQNSNNKTLHKSQNSFVPSNTGIHFSLLLKKNNSFSASVILSHPLKFPTLVGFLLSCCLVFHYEKIHCYHVCNRMAYIVSCRTVRKTLILERYKRDSTVISLNTRIQVSSLKGRRGRWEPKALFSCKVELASH